MAYSYEGLKGEYTRLLARMVITRAGEGRAAALRLADNRARYQRVEAETGVPWRFIAIIHNRESGGNFAGVLHNGEHIIGTGKKTRLVPAGRGPFKSWEEAAIDALRLKGLHLIEDWPRERICYEAERFNGFGYRNKSLPSPYLWAGSNNYRSGKYVADGVFDPSAVDKQLGCMVVYDYLAKMGEVIPQPIPDVEPIPAPAPRKSFLQILAAILKAIFKR